MNSENSIIKFLQASSRGFIGDDAAILPPISSGNRYCITKDLLVENIHFRTTYYTPGDLAHKALYVNLSDLAAMGAEPSYILCGIAIPNHLQNYAISFLHDLTDQCESAEVILIGGDTTAATHNLLISITAIGQTPESNIKSNNMAKNNDIICVAGNLGFAHLGLMGLEQSLVVDEKYIKSLLRPEAKIKEGVWLGKQSAVNSMTDISDGLYANLLHLVSQSHKGALLDLNLIQKYLPAEISLQIALEGGEDYSLLLTITPESFPQLSHEFSQIFGYELKPVGKIIAETGISFTQDNHIVNMVIHPFTHFGEN